MPSFDVADYLDELSDAELLEEARRRKLGVSNDACALERALWHLDRAYVPAARLILEQALRDGIPHKGQQKLL